MKSIKSIACGVVQRLSKLSLAIRQIYRSGGRCTPTIAYLRAGETLTGKRILVTGGGSGIGLSIAKRCLSEGAVVLITGRNLEKLESAARKMDSPNLLYMQWDVSDVVNVKQNVQRACELLGGGFEVLINNAGVVNGGSFPNVSEATWDTAYAVNSKGLFFATQAVCSLWLNESQKYTRKVINISSQGGYVGATYPYRMTKWDVAGLTAGLGLKLAPNNIIVNGIAPGITATNAISFIGEQVDNIYCSLVPLERCALPDEIAELASFLISDRSNFIVGQTIVCDGGFTLK
jgi:NAD(P)-dependent dehydrogenase (short-subunit alcohol dehydrogenase family)